MLRRLITFTNQISHIGFANPIRRFQLSILTLVGLIVFATSGYMLLEAMSFTDALYMTVITITTVGFGEIKPLSETGRIFTILIILLGVTATTNAISNAVGIVLGPRLWLSIRQRNMEREITRIKDHYVVCGYGRMGRQVVQDLRRREEPFVLIDANPEVAPLLLEQNILHIIGDATRDETLLAAGIDRARGLVAAVNSDPENVMIVLTGRELNPNLFIVARVSQSEAESKLRRAGANRVVSPYQIGGHRIALALIRPAVNDFLDRIFHFERDLDIDIGQITIHAEMPLAGQTIGASNLRNEHDVSILAIRKPNGELTISPRPTDTLNSGDTVIIIGPPAKIYALEKDYATR
ncbi:MAG: potassium channel protein [Anaerolineae bacterium]